MKNPTTAPSKLKIILTSIANTPTNVVQIKKNIVKPKNNFLSRCGLSTNDMNYFLVRKSRMGMTEKFWKKIPACTTFPIM
jgi:hypothetical protein